MFFNENIKYSLDGISIENVVDGKVLSIRGWLFSEIDLKKVVLELCLSSGEKKYFDFQTFGISSPDIMKALGDRASNVRFDERFEIASDFVLSESSINIYYENNEFRKLSLTNKRKHFSSNKTNKKHLGIGITTYQRPAALDFLLNKLYANTKVEFELIVADDGSNDETLSVLDGWNVPYITGVNKGVAWNKNRALYYLYAMELCNNIILIEDDTYPIVLGWEEEWLAAIKKWGHVNLAGHWFRDKYIGGYGSAFDPIKSFVTSGQVTGFSRAAIDQVGFLDSRFKKYGFEHVDHTNRCIKNGFGGYMDGENYIYYLISGGVTVTHMEDPRFIADIADNAVLYDQIIKADSSFRWAWSNKDQKDEFMHELSNLHYPR